MKVTSNMIHKDIRTIGVIIRKTYTFRNEKQFRTCNKMLNRFMKRRFPKDIQVEERYILRSDNTEMRILICYPNTNKVNATGVLWIHGGGYALGIPEQEMGYVKAITENTNSIVILPEYTLSVDKPYPAALEDCYTALIWMKEHASELGINQDQLFVAGESAGGGLTAALAIDYNDLPNTYTFVGTIEPFYDETMDYIENLKKAGVNAKVDVYEGCYHAFDLFGSKKQIGKQATEKWIKEFKYAVENYFEKQI